MKSQGQELKNTSGTATQLLQKGLHGLFRIHREQCLEKQTENLMKTNFESFRYIYSDETLILYLYAHQLSICKAQNNQN
jgi:hypothetical protein